MLNVESVKGVQRSGQIVRIKDIDPGVVQRSQARDGRMMCKEYGRGLSRGCNELCTKWCLRVPIEDHARRRDA
jgi:hypothetical protein